LRGGQRAKLPLKSQVIFDSFVPSRSAVPLGKLESTPLPFGSCQSARGKRRFADHSWRRHSSFAGTSSVVPARPL